ncbi:hypothetical protein [Sediminibacterium soli]|uniref:hypothetical protein n=1 Tax=Sediminibacterium soli TaxID=2698829 RepID=UPI001379E98E|nr:hypothetical protein [Sediminibacterium soli]NCI46979.1 hypothetical protein [Sediminibacterium soli]
MRTARRLSVCLLLTASFLALYSGIHLILDPTGSSLHFPFFLLRGTIFYDYYMIGCILSVTIGLFSLMLVVSILLKTGFYSMGIMLQGVIICMYVFMMLLLLRRIFLIEFFFLLLGIGMIAVGLVQYQRKIVVEIEKVQKESPAPEKEPSSAD